MVRNLWNWIRRDAPAPPARPMQSLPDPPAAAPRAHFKAGPFRPLHDYLRKRFADSIVLTFDQIEDLNGVALPPEARSDEAWWSDAAAGTDGRCSDAWVLANRSAQVNLSAKTVLFDRVG